MVTVTAVTKLQIVFGLTKPSASLLAEGLKIKRIKSDAPYLFTLLYYLFTPFERAAAAAAVEVFLQHTVEDVVGRNEVEEGHR